MKKIITMILMCLFAVTFATGCARNTEDKQKDEKIKVVFGDAGWDSMRFHNAVAMFIGKTAYNLEPEEVSGTTAITYSALKSGDISVYMETWTNGLPTYNDDLTKGAITELSINYDDNIQGFYVPRYVIEGDPDRGIEPMAPDLKTVEDLKEYSNIFVDPDDPSKGRIYGAISGWEVDKVLRNKYDFYGLDELYNYMDPGSDSALAAAISSAYEKREPIVAYYWEPTWITGQYDLVLLEDAPYDEAIYNDGKCAFPSNKVTVVVNSDFLKTAPEFCAFLSNYQTSSELTANALSYIQANQATYENTAKWFLKEHDELLDKWLPADRAELIRDALSN